MRVSSCKNCGAPILWLPRNDESERWNPPLDAESAQSGYCVIAGRVEFTYMYRKHQCTTDAIQAYQVLLQLQAERNNPPDTFRHLDGTPEDAALREAEGERVRQAELRAAEARAAERARAAEAKAERKRKQDEAAADAAADAPQFSDAVPQVYHRYYGNVPENETNKFRQQSNLSWEDVKALRWADALKRECPTCGREPGEKCRDMRKQFTKTGTVREIAAPHSTRLSDHWHETEENL